MCSIFFSIPTSFSQINVDQANDLELNPESLVRNVFIGQGVKVESVDFFGTNNAIGVFRNGNNDIGLNRGIVISTGGVETLAMSNNDKATGSSTSSRTVKSDELAAIAGSDLFDVAIIELQFRPVDDLIGFNFVFGSEEYPEFVCSQFNDVFAFFIDGPDPNGGNYVSENIALIPDPSDPTGNTFTDFPVTINSVNNGEIGLENGNGTCTELGESLAFSTYFNNNDLSRTFTLDGFLDVFRAQVNVMPCELYTLKLAIGDGFDDAYDSVVFLEAKSFSSAVHTVFVDAPGVDYTMMEGCDPTKIKVQRLDNSSDALDINFEIVEGPNSAVRGVDYTLNRNELVIQEGQEDTELIITPLDDGLSEGDEMIYFVFRNGDCFRDTVRIGILDYKTPDFAVPIDTMLCEGERIQLEEDGDFNQLKIFEKSGEFPIGDPIRGDCRSTIVVSDLDIQFLNEASFVQVCIDQLEHQMLSDMEIYLVSPGGQVLELSTNNGEDGGNEEELDHLINTCFTLNSAALINGGNQEEGPFLSSNPAYTGNFSPEQNFEDFFGGFYSPVNGKWSLVIKDDQNEDLQGTLFQWSLKFNPQYSEVRSYIINGNNVFGSPTIVDENSEITETITQNYGCTFTRSSTVDFTPLPEAPTVSCSNPRRNQIFLEWSDSDVDEYEVKIGTGQWEVITEGTEFLADNLGLSANYSFEVRAVKNGCLGPSEQYLCTTPPCADTEIIIENTVSTSSGCLNNGQIDVTVTSNDGPYRYQLDAQTSDDGIFTGLAIGAYRVFATDIYGCTFRTTINIEGVEPIQLGMEGSKVSCDADIRGTAITLVSGGQEPFQYQWNNGAITSSLTKIEQGIYAVTVTDANGCTQTNEVEVEEGNIPSVVYTQTNVSCFGDPTGSVQLSASGGDGPYEYRWADGFATVLPERKNLSAGIYSVSVLDVNRCYALAEIEITEPENFATTIEKEDNDCFGMSAGIARLNILGGTSPYDIYWSNGEKSSAIGNLEAGEYGVTITDSGGCRSENSITITEPSERSIIFEEQPITCHKGENGTLTAQVQGSNGNFTYEWDNGRAFQSINNLEKGRYCVTITDENGCVINDCFVMEEPPAMSISVEAHHITCFQSTDGSLQIDLTGVLGPYTIELNGETVLTQSNGLVTELRSGTYFVKVIDAIGCSTSDVIEIIEASEPSLYPEVEHIDCIGDKTGSIFMRYQNEPNATMLWTDDQGNEYEGRRITELKSGSYNYEISTRTGCVLTGSVIVNEPPDPLKLEVNSTNITCHEDRDGSITINGQGGSGGYFYSLDGNNFQRAGQYRGLKADTYRTYIKDENGCTVEGDTITISEPNPLEVSLRRDTTIETGTDLEIIPQVTNGQGELMYEWIISSEQELSCTDCSNLYVNNVSEDFLLRIQVEDDRLCTAADEVRVFVIKDYEMHVPTGFSPNGDTKNEILNVFGPEFGLIKEFNIYLRNGTNIYNEYNFRPNTTSKGWDGTFRGKIMPAGIYIWTMHVEYDDGARQSFKGSVQLIR
tara:strand:+ start:2506 stop:7050 length:4545 start_codon:yes stop_codon:yes gene_type:complete